MQRNFVCYLSFLLASAAQNVAPGGSESSTGETFAGTPLIDKHHHLSRVIQLILAKFRGE